MTELLSIGAFSKVTRLSVKALRLYDRLDLLIPEQVDPSSGYRYYSVAQAARARAIALLRSLDMPLADIKQVLAERDTRKFRLHMDRHRDVLLERLTQHERMLRRVERLIQQGGLETMHVTVKQIPPATVCGIVFECPVEEVGAQSGRAYERLYPALAQVGIEPVGPPRLVYLDMPMDDSGRYWRVEANVPIAAGDPPSDDMIVREMPAAEVASLLHRGPYEELGMAWKQLETWIVDSGREFAGPAFDVYLTDPAETPDPADHETELCWPIRPL